MIDDEVLHGFVELFRTVCVNVFSLGLWSKESLEPSKGVSCIFGLSSITLKPQGIPVLDDQGNLVMRPGFVIFIEDSMVGRNGIDELLGFGEFIWFSRDLDATLCSLCLASSANRTFGVLGKMSVNVVSSRRCGLSKGFSFSLRLCRSRGARGRTRWIWRMCTFLTFVFNPRTSAR